MCRHRFLTVTLFLLISSGLSGLPTAYFISNEPVCQGNPVCFTDYSYIGSPPFGWINTWIWNFGDGSPADTIHFPNYANPCHQYALAGTFQVSLTVIDNNGNTDIYTANAVTWPKPIANFMYTGSCAGQPVYFTDLSITNWGFITGWEWNFGDGSTSSQQNPAHNFASAGTYAVRLIITSNYGCSDSLVQFLFISQAPAGGSVAGNATIILGQNTGPMILSGNTGVVVSWQRNLNGEGYSDIAGTSGLTSYSEIPVDTGTWNYRAAVQSGSCNPVYASPATVMVTAPGAYKIWTGASDYEWENPGNWNPAGIPVSTDNIIIPCCVSVMPQVRNNGFSCNNVNIQPGATLKVGQEITLVIFGTVVLQ